MQIINGGNGTALPNIEQPVLQFKQGETAPLHIKNRLGKQEAVAVIHGQEVKVQFEGKMPREERLTVVIGHVNDHGFLVVRSVANQPSMKATVTDSLKMMITNAGFPLEKNGDLLSAAKLLAANGGTINEEILTNMQYFLTTEPGTLTEKLKTIETMLEKRLELSVTQLSAVHQTLHGKNTTETLSGLIKSLGLHFDLEGQVVVLEKEFQAITQALDGKGDLQSAVEKWLHSLERVSEINDGAVQLKNDQIPYAVQLPSDFRSKDMIVTEITKKLSELAADFKTEQRGISQNLEGILHRADTKQNRAAVKQTLENTIHKLNQVILKSDMMLYADMETERKLLGASSKLAQAAGLIEKGNFSEAKAIVREIKDVVDKLKFTPANVKIQHFTGELLKQHPGGNGLNRIEQALKPLQSQQHSARHVFETIKALGLTNEQDIARGLLVPAKQGQQVNVQEEHLKPAQHQDLQNNLRGQEQPSKLKASIVPQTHSIQHSESQGILKQAAGGHGENSLLQAKPIQQLSELQPNQLAAQQPNQQINLKAALLKFLQTEQAKTIPGQEVEQSIAHLTGQQLLNKSDSTGQGQIYLQLPLLLDNKMENIKVYISSDKKGETLDWENCSLYFVLETKKMGEVGIMVHVQNRQLSLTLKNNEELFQEKMEPLAGETLKHLEEIGYNTGTIQYGSFTHSVLQKEEKPKIEKVDTHPAPAPVKKGFDFSI